MTKKIQKNDKEKMNKKRWWQKDDKKMITKRRLNKDDDKKMTKIW